ncbi:unnamed protein product, partial [Pocillopora meandrina]
SEENGSVVSVKSCVSALCPTDNPERTNSQRLSTEEYASKEPEKASIERFAAADDCLDTVDNSAEPRPCSPEEKKDSPAKQENVVNNFPDAEPSTSFGMAMFSNLAAWRVKDETSEDDKSSEGQSDEDCAKQQSNSKYPLSFLDKNAVEPLEIGPSFKNKEPFPTPVTTSAQESPGCDNAQDDQVTEEILFDREVPESNQYEDALYRLGVRTKDDKDIIFIDTDKLPKREHFKNKKEFKQAVREFISYLEAFILTYVDTHHFLIVVHGGSEKCAIKDELRRKIYNKLKTGFLDRLSKCIIFKPQRKLKALGLFLRPFLNREMKQRIAMTTSKRYLHDIQGIPDFVTKHL